MRDSTMRILIAGASGFIGRELVKTLVNNHQIIVLGRDIKLLDKAFPKIVEKLTWDNLDSFDARNLDIIINVAGSNIGAKRWTVAVKKELIESRTLTNKRLIDCLIKQNAHPHYYCANAIGIYGAFDNNKTSFDENYPVSANKTNDFLKQIGLTWQESLIPAIDHGIKVTTLRFGVVLKKGEGMLKKLELPFYLGLGSILGTGNQMISWIHYQDLVDAVMFLIDHPEITGPVNITSPNPISQKELADQLARALKRPLILKIPTFMVKALFGEMGEYLLLKGQKVVPAKLVNHGFEFTYPDLASALKHEYSA